MADEADPNERPPGGGASRPRRPETLATLPPPGRRFLVLLLVNAALAAAAFGPLIQFDPELHFSHEVEGVFFTPADTSPTVVILLSLWLFYRRWGRLRRLPLESGPVWLTSVLLAAAAGVLAWAAFVGANDLRVISLMLGIFGIACLFGGTQAMRTVVVPTGFLIFAIPMPAPLLNVMLMRMQFWTAEFTGFVFHMAGQSAFIAGDTILREGNHFAIIETCSGVRLTETLTMLTILMVDLFRRSRLHGAIMIVLAPLVAFVSNGARAVTLILNPHSNIHEIHTAQGIGMLLVGLLVLYGLDWLLGRALGERSMARAPVAAPRPAIDAELGATARLRIATAALAVFAGLALAVPQWEPPPFKAPTEMRSELSEVAGERSVALRVDHRFLGRIGSQRSIHRRFKQHPNVLDVYVALGTRDRRPRSVLFSKGLLPGSGWNTREEGRVTLDPGGTEATWRLSVSGTRNFLVYSWQEEADSLLVESLRSFTGLDSSPFRRPGHSIVVRMRARIVDPGPAGLAAAEERLHAFYAALRPILDEIQAGLVRDTS